MRRNVLSRIITLNASATIAGVVLLMSLHGCNLGWMVSQIDFMPTRRPSLANTGRCTIWTEFDGSGSRLKSIDRIVVPKGTIAHTSKTAGTLITGEWRVSFAESVTSPDDVATSIEERRRFVFAKTDETFYFAPTGIVNAGGVRSICHMEIYLPDHIEVIEEEGLGFWVAPPEGALSEYQHQMGYGQLDWKPLSYRVVIERLNE